MTQWNPQAEEPNENAHLAVDVLDVMGNGVPARSLLPEFLTVPPSSSV